MTQPPQRPSFRPSMRPQQLDPADRPELHKSLPPSEPRKRAFLAVVCATLLGASLVAAFVRSCEGESAWDSEAGPADPD